VRHTAFPARPRWSPSALPSTPTHNNNTNLNCALLSGSEASGHCLGPCTIRIVYTGKARPRRRSTSAASNCSRATSAVTRGLSVVSQLACPVCDRPGITIVGAQRGHDANMLNLRRHSLLRKRAPQHGDAKRAAPSAVSLTQIGRRRTAAGGGGGGGGQGKKRGSDDGAVGHETRQLVWACHNGHAKRVGDLLRSRDIDIDFRGEHGWTPMLHACHHGCVEIVW
jgi:hypothetical protein